MCMPLPRRRIARTSASALPAPSARRPRTTIETRPCAGCTRFPFRWNRKPALYSCFVASSHRCGSRETSRPKCDPASGSPENAPERRQHRRFSCREACASAQLGRPERGMLRVGHPSPLPGRRGSAPDAGALSESIRSESISRSWLCRMSATRTGAHFTGKCSRPRPFPRCA